MAFAPRRSSPLSDKKIVVTGGSGNLGRWTVRALVDAGYEVLNIDIKAPETSRCPYQNIDMADANAVKIACAGMDAVIHLAGYQAPYMAAHPEVFQNNITATYNVFWAAAEAGIRRVVFGSSIAAYGFLYAPEIWSPDYLPLDENHPCRPQDPYALSKVFGEQIADSFVEKAGLSAVSLRLSGVNFDVSYASLPERWADPGAKMGTFWSYIDVRDAADAFRLSLEADITGHEIFNIAAESSRYPQQTSELVQSHFPDTAIKNGMTGHWSGLDCRRAQEQLGFVPRHHWSDYLNDNGTPR